MILLILGGAAGLGITLDVMLATLAAHARKQARTEN